MSTIWDLLLFPDTASATAFGSKLSGSFVIIFTHFWQYWQVLVAMAHAGQILGTSVFVCFLLCIGS
jgi:hypothetical protein